MLVLLGISTAIAIIAPDPDERVAESGATGSTSPTEGVSPGATSTTGNEGSDRAVEPTADPMIEEESTRGTKVITSTISIGRRPESVCVRPGSRLVLTVKTGRPLDLWLPDFGRTATATSYAPAIFDLLIPEEPGRYRVETLDAERALAIISSNRTCLRPGRPDPS